MRGAKLVRGVVVTLLSLIYRRLIPSLTRSEVKDGDSAWFFWEFRSKNSAPAPFAGRVSGSPVCPGCPLSDQRPPTADLSSRSVWTLLSSHPESRFRSSGGGRPVG